jgi:rod shape determining protein RodA
MSVKIPEMSTAEARIRMVYPRNLLRIDPMLPLFVITLAVIGWVTMYSASRSSDILYFHRQILFFFIGLAVVIPLICIDYRVVVALAPLMYLAIIGILAAVLVAGHEAKGSERWLNLGPFNLQPSEFAKIVMIYMLTWYFTRLGARIRKLHWFLITFLLSSIPMALVLKQPNLGTAASLVPLTVVMLFVAGARFRHLVLIVIAGLFLVPLVWLQIHDFDPVRDRPKPASYYENHPEEKPAPGPFYELHYHQKKRIYSFLYPESDLRDSGWQTYQSKIAVGSGGLDGKGFLNSTQTRLNYLPEHHTDFIFSLLAEERGFIGAVVVIGLFAAFFFRGLIFARDCPDMAGTLLAAGVVTILAFHVFVNVAITIGLLPVTGIPLPFLSYGGSFYMTTMACTGILLNVPMRRKLFVN